MTSRALPAASEGAPKSVPLREMIKLGRLVLTKCENDIVLIELEVFDAENACWNDPIGVKIKLDRSKFSSGCIIYAYRCAGKSGLDGDLVLKQYRPERIHDLTNLFSSLESHI